MIYASSAAVHQLNGPFTCHTQMIYPSSIVVHKRMVHLPVTPQWFVQVVQQSHKLMVHLFVTHQWFILVVQQSTKWWFIYLSQTNDLSKKYSSPQNDCSFICHTPMIFPSSAAVHQIWFIYLSHTMTYSCSAAVRKMIVHLLSYTNDLSF